MEIRIYVANLAKYNEGVLQGEWITLPIDDEYLEKALERILGDDEEIAIHDFEAPFRIHEYDSISRLNEIAEELENYTHLDDIILEGILEHTDSIDEALDILRDSDFRTYHDCQTMEHVAMEIVEEAGYLDGAPEFLQRYFDYEAYGRDLEVNGYFYYLGGGVYLELIR